MIREPWQRQAGESRQAFAAFRRYLEAGPTRRVTDVAAECNRSPSLLFRWSARWSWVARAEAYDDEQVAIFDAERVEAIRAMSRRHAAIARLAIARVAEALQNVDPQALTPGELIRWLDVAARVEREALGVPRTLELTGAGGGPVAVAAEVTELTDEERRARLLGLRREIDSRLGEQPLPQPAVLRPVTT